MVQKVFRVYSNRQTTLSFALFHLLHSWNCCFGYWRAWQGITLNKWMKKINELKKLEFGILISHPLSLIPDPQSWFYNIIPNLKPYSQSSIPTPIPIPNWHLHHHHHHNQFILGLTNHWFRLVSSQRILLGQTQVLNMHYYWSCFKTNVWHNDIL